MVQRCVELTVLLSEAEPGQMLDDMETLNLDLPAGGGFPRLRNCPLCTATQWAHSSFPTQQVKLFEHQGHTEKLPSLSEFLNKS